MLLNVGKVLLALSEKNTHIPYRNSPLTRLLSDSLGGNAKTLMFVNVSPTNSNLSETTKSLLYGVRARDIQNAASKNVQLRHDPECEQQLAFCVLCLKGLCGTACARRLVITFS